jgi:hypothetical protein
LGIRFLQVRDGSGRRMLLCDFDEPLLDGQPAGLRLSPQRGSIVSAMPALLPFNDKAASHGCQDGSILRRKNRVAASSA